mgnify:CR=1 FL=1
MRFFSISEISLAASRKIKLKLLADEGNVNAQRVLKMQENPGTFFTVVQIGLNAVAILGGIVGDAAFSPAFHSLLSGYLSPELSEQLSFIISFDPWFTSLFILFADLTPKRIGMIAPETVAHAHHQPDALLSESGKAGAAGRRLPGLRPLQRLRRFGNISRPLA